MRPVSCAEMVGWTDVPLAVEDTAVDSDVIAFPGLDGSTQDRPTSSIDPFPDDPLPAGELRYDSTAGGTTGAEWVLDEAGGRWLAKADCGAPELQTAAEVIGTTVYRVLGYPAPIAHIGQWWDQRVVLLSDLGPGFVGEQAPPTSRCRRLFLHAAFLADTNRLKNPGTMGDCGLPALYDCAGALGAKAHGAPKSGGVPFSPAVGYFPAETRGERILAAFYRPPNRSHPWNCLVGPDIDAASAELKTLTDDTIAAIVERASYSRPKDALYMITTLRRRRDALLEGLSAWYEGERQRRQDPVQAQRGPEWIRTRRIECRKIGRAAARLFASARREDRPSCRSLEEVLVWYRGHPGFSPSLEGDLSFVETHREDFAALFAQGV